jgi:ring-1,2-phenylacetyl-CoA epoxidase subunit PaaD
VPAAITPDAVYEILGSVMDPEVPVISVVELGIVRQVTVEDGVVGITITPTYSGCPAMGEMQRDMTDALAAQGIHHVSFQMVYAPAWTTDWIGPEAREKLRKFGIAPPGPAEREGLITLTRARVPVACPYCGAKDTQLKSEFGSTACKAIHVCNACKQPFDEFKPL